jgi:hypothetical protein
MVGLLGHTQGHGIAPAKRGGAVQGIGGVCTYDGEMLGGSTPRIAGVPYPRLGIATAPAPGSPSSSASPWGVALWMLRKFIFGEPMKPATN